MKHAKVFFLCIFMLLTAITGYAQTSRITGIITDATGEPIIGANVTVKGSTIGSISDIDGNFQLEAPASGTLIISYIGYKQLEVALGRSIYNIVLQEDFEQLDEVVVVGYGTQKKANLTGAVGSVSSDEVMARPAPNTSSLLQGRVPGLQIVQNSGQPGNESVDIQIRGMGTFSSAGNNPLVLIDGIEGDLNTVNPNMIENISVLKDAASASIYGSRAANGVILVTTKSGSSGRLNIDYSYNLGYQKATSVYDRITNSVEFMQLLNKAILHTGTNASQMYSEEQIEMYRQGSITNPDQYPNYDWMDAIFRTSPMHQHFLSLNGGNGGTTYNLGMGYLDQDGILIATNYKKYDVQFNFKTNLGSRVTFGTNIAFVQSNRHDTALNNSPDGNTTEDQILSALAANPTFKPYLPDGSGRYASKAFDFESGNKNPVAVAENGGRDYRKYGTLASAFVDVDIIDGLKASFKAAVNYSDEQSKMQVVAVPGYLYLPDETGSYLFNTQWNGTLGENNFTVRNKKEIQYTYFINLNYDKTFADKHTLNVLGGFSQETFRYDFLEGYRKNAPSDDLLELDAYSPSGQTTSGKAHEWAMQSYFARVNYNYLGKYLFEANIRADGSSRFPSDNRWGLFPSVSAGWRMSEESFMQTDWMDNLKIRASWGQLGNQNIGQYPYQATLEAGEYTIGGTLEQALYLSELANRDIKWETTTVTNVGLDFSFINGRLYGSVDGYVKRTTDILRELQVPTYIGVTGPTVNDGEMKNSGFEFVLGHENRIGNVRYSVQGNLETYRNKLIKYGAREINSSSGYIKEEGLPYNSFYMYVFDGIYQNQAEIDNGPTPLNSATKPGDMKYKDLNNDGVIDENDRQLVDGAFPKFNYGLNLRGEYKNFDLSIFFQGVQGKKIYVKEWGIAPFRQSSPPPTFWRDAWDGEGTSNTIPHIFNENYGPNTAVSDWWLQNASYFRMKNLQLGYNVPKSALLKTKTGVQYVRVYFSGDNLLTATKFFKGGDPERTSNSARMAIYPQAKIYSFGIKVSF